MKTEYHPPLANEPIRIEEVSLKGLRLSTGEGREKETTELTWAEFYRAMKHEPGSSYNPIALLPESREKQLVATAIDMASNLKVRIISVREHPFNQVNAQTVAGTNCRMMGVDWCYAQHAFEVQAEREAAELTKMYERRGYQVVRRG